MKPTSRRYFVDFEFWSDSDQLYWFPLCLQAENQQPAEVFAERIAAGLRVNYEITHSSSVIPVISGLSSETITVYRKARATGIPMLLNMNLWKMRSVRGPADVAFEAQATSEIEKLMPDFELPATLATGEQRHFRVNLVASTRPPREEFLLINVVGPAD